MTLIVDIIMLFGKRGVTQNLKSSSYLAETTTNWSSSSKRYLYHTWSMRLLSH